MISYEDIECTCLTKQEKRRAFLLCCIRVDEPCPIHSSNFTDTTLVHPEAGERKERKKLSLYQKIKSILLREKYKDLTEELTLEILHETREIPQKIQEIPANASKDTPAGKNIIQKNENTDGDLFAAVLSSLAETETRRRKRQNRKSKEILKKYADYDENRERMLS